nr:MAG TPA: hypothetical protein [Caudoviricetes sp.]
MRESHGFEYSTIFSSFLAIVRLSPSMIIF